MNETSHLLQDSLDTLFTRHSTREVCDSMENKVWPKDLWQHLVEGGFTHLLAQPKDGYGWQEACLLFTTTGLHHLPAPLSEMVLAQWFLGAAGLPSDDACAHSLTTVAWGDFSLRKVKGNLVLSGTAPSVAWGAYADFFVTVVSHQDLWWLVRAPCSKPYGEKIKVTHAYNSAGEPRDIIKCRDVEVEACPLPRGTAFQIPVPPFQGGDISMNNPLLLAGALMRCCQIAGALQAVQNMTVQYAHTRKQFGRTLASFQAVGQQLAQLASQTACVRLASQSAWRGGGDFGDDTPDLTAPWLDFFPVAVAACRANAACDTVVGMAHQVHGAMGMTHEYGLHYLTRRLMSWRWDFGGGDYWARCLGGWAYGQKPENLWDGLTKMG